MYSTSNTHFDLLNLIVLTELGKDYKTYKTNYAIFSSLSTLPLFQVQILSYIESSYTLHLYSSFHAKDHISYLNKTAGKIRVFFLTFIFLDRKCEGTYSQLSDSKHTKNLILPENTILSGPFHYQRYLYFSTLFKDL